LSTHSGFFGENPIVSNQNFIGFSCAEISQKFACWDIPNPFKKVILPLLSANKFSFATRRKKHDRTPTTDTTKVLRYGRRKSTYSKENGTYEDKKHVWLSS